MASSSSYEIPKENKRSLVTTRRGRRQVGDIQQAVTSSRSPIGSPRVASRSPSPSPSPQEQPEQFAWHALYGVGEVDTYVEEDDFDVFAKAQASNQQLLQAALNSDGEEGSSGQEDEFDMFKKSQALHGSVAYASELALPWGKDAIVASLHVGEDEVTSRPGADAEFSGPALDKEEWSECMKHGGVVQDLREIQDRHACERAQTESMHLLAYCSIDEADAVGASRAADDWQPLSTKAFPSGKEAVVPSLHAGEDESEPALGKEALHGSNACASELAFPWGKDAIVASLHVGEELTSRPGADAEFSGPALDKEEWSECLKHGEVVQDLREIQERLACEPAQTESMHVLAYCSMDEADAVGAYRAADDWQPLSTKAFPSGEDAVVPSLHAGEDESEPALGKEELSEERRNHVEAVKELCRLVCQRAQTKSMHVPAYCSWDQADGVRAACGVDDWQPLSAKALHGPCKYASELAVPWGKDAVVASLHEGEDELASANDADAELRQPAVDKEEARRRQDKGVWLRLLGTMCERCCMW